MADLPDAASTGYWPRCWTWGFHCGISRWGLRPSGLWRSVGWFVTDVSEQPADPVLKGQDDLERLFNRLHIEQDLSINFRS